VNKNELYIEELIARKMTGEITPSENIQLQLWMDASEENRKYFDQLSYIYNESEFAEAVVEVDTDKAWNELKFKISEQKKGTIIPLYRKRFLRIAAMLLLTAGAGYLFYMMMHSSGTEYRYAALDTPSLFTLPDSSTIFLNKYSTAVVTVSEKERKTVLTGEGFFTVVHNEKQPFIVEAGGLTIKDIGTAFNVNANDSSKVDVIVTEGEVELASQEKKLNLVKGDRSIFNKEDNSLKKLTSTEANLLSYSTKIFVFENTSLPAAVEKLREVYGLDIRVDDNLKFCRLTSTFRNEKIEVILQVIAETLQLQLSKEGNNYHFTGNSCAE